MLLVKSNDELLLAVCVDIRFKEPPISEAAKASASESHAKNLLAEGVTFRLF